VSWLPPPFEQVDDYFWSAPPYSTDLVIYDEQGRTVKLLHSIYPDALTLEDFEGANLADRDDIAALRAKRHNWYIAPAGDLVFVSFGLSFDVYDRRGNILKHDLQGQSIGMILDAFEGHLVTALPELDTLWEYGVVHPDLPQMLTAAGWTEANAHNANPLVRIDRILLDD